jgi:hypothetical protein
MRTATLLSVAIEDREARLRPKSAPAAHVGEAVRVGGEAKKKAGQRAGF